MSGVYYHPQGLFVSLRDNKTTKMFKLSIAALAAAPLLASGAAFAGPYVNVEANASYPDGEYSSATTDVHFGFEGTNGDGQLGYYVQGGPAFKHNDDADNETEFSGKAGITVAATESLGVYGELAGITGEKSNEDIIDWSAKIGAKFTF